MATKDQIKKAILEASGNPESGIVRANVDKWADAIVALDIEDKPARKEKVEDLSDKEIRVTKASETR